MRLIGRGKLFAIHPITLFVSGIALQSPERIAIIETTHDLQSNFSIAFTTLPLSGVVMLV